MRKVKNKKMKSLKVIRKKNSGRTQGKVVVRHQGGAHKRFYRNVDFKRAKHDIWGKIVSIEYDPNRNADVALVLYEDGVKNFILSPDKLKLEDKVVASENAPIEPGNCLPLEKIPVGTQIHNLEITRGKGGQMVKSAGTAAVVFGQEEDWILVKLPSGQVRRFYKDAWATVGQVGNLDHKHKKLGKAGRSRRMGIRPTVRGVAQHPDSHPHGGGEGRSGIGLKYPKTVYGKKAVGKTRSKKKYSDRLILKEYGKKH